MRGMQIASTVDFERDGRQDGFLRLPHSTDDSAYGHIPIPVTCIKRGAAPNLLLIAGNHGDEYEGQVALRKLLATLRPEEMRGRLIVLPAANLPAVLAGRRVAPHDEGNLNRSFIAGPPATPTQQIAAFIEHELLARCDHAIDLHSGGASLRYLPAGVGNIVHDRPERNDRVREMLAAFGAPVSFVSDTRLASSTSFASAAIRQGVVAIGTEAGGGASLSVAALRMVEDGIRRVMVRLGMLDGDIEWPGTRLFEVGGPDYFVYAPAGGIFEPFVEPGAEVKAGDPAAAIHALDGRGGPPAIAHFVRDGMVLCRREQGLARAGDCLFHLGSPVA